MGHQMNDSENLIGVFKHQFSVFGYKKPNAKMTEHHHHAFRKDLLKWFWRNAMLPRGCTVESLLVSPNTATKLVELNKFGKALLSSAYFVSKILLFAQTRRESEPINKAKNQLTDVCNTIEKNIRNNALALPDQLHQQHMAFLLPLIKHEYAQEAELLQELEKPANEFSMYHTTELLMLPLMPTPLSLSNEKKKAAKGSPSGKTKSPRRPVISMDISSAKTTMDFFVLTMCAYLQIESSEAIELLSLKSKKLYDWIITGISGDYSQVEQWFGDIMSRVCFLVPNI